MTRPKTFTEYAERFLTGAEPVIDVHGGDDDAVWPSVVIRHAGFSAVLNLTGHGDHLCIDVHSFVGGKAARAGVFGMETGRRFHLSDTDTDGTSHGFPAASLVAVLIGEQKETPRDEPEDATQAATEALMARLYDAVTDDELTVLDELMYRTGLLWKCQSCGHNNTQTQDLCESCTGTRPPADAEESTR